MRISAIQMLASTSLEANLKQAEDLIAQAVSEGANLIVLPEYFAYYGCGSGDCSRAETASERGVLEVSEDGPVRSFLREQARKQGVWLVGGTLPVADKPAESRPYAASFVLDDRGCEVARYNKIHLFDVDVAEGGDQDSRYRESQDYCPGDTPVVVETPFGKLGLSVCYDLRFPELYRYLSACGAEILLVPSAFTAATGKAHWQLLLRARAVENLCYVVGANMGDRNHPGKPTWGGSTIIDPWGGVIAEIAGGQGVVSADIDLQKLKQLQKKMPALEHRRLSVVKS